MKLLSRLVIVSMVLMLALASFGIASAQDDSVLVLGVEQEPPNLNPLNTLVFGGLPESIYARDLWDWDENRQIFPIMAAEIPSIDNGMVVTTAEGDTAVTVTLKEGLMWSDGTPITTADCEVWHHIRFDPTTSDSVSRANYPDVVKSFEVVDDLTFTLTYTGTYPEYLAATERPQCRYPGHIFGPAIENGGKLEDLAYFTSGPTVGYGPYIMTEWNIGENMMFEKNPYWQGDEPGFDRLVWQFLTDSTQMRNALEVGDVDITFNWSDDLQPLYGEIEGVETFNAPAVFSDALWIRSGPNGNEDSPAPGVLESSEVRQGIAHALPRLLFAEALVGPGIAVPTSWYPPALWPEDLPFLDYDVALAREMLDSAGFVDEDGDEPAVEDIDPAVGCDATTPRVGASGVAMQGLRFVTTEGNTLRENYQLVIQAALNCVGIGTDIQIHPATTLFAAFADRGVLTTYQWDLAIFANSSQALTPLGDADSYQCSGIPSAENPDGFNPWQFCDPRYDELDNLIAATLAGPERDEMIAEAVTRHFGGYFWHGLRLRATWFAVDTTVLDPASVQANVGTLSSNWMDQIEYWEPAS